MWTSSSRRLVETSTEYARRPRAIAWLNSVGRLLERLGALPPLEEGRLIAAARRKTGLHDFGDQWFREPLGVLLDSMNREARLTPLGKWIQRRRIVGLLANRLRAEALVKAHPEILEIPLGPVIVIAGLQRTGTTLLHRLLAADSDTRSLLAWEALNPVPFAGEKAGRPTARIRQGRLAERGLAYLAPHFFAIHPTQHDAPEEDVLLLDMSFMSQASEAMLHVPSYAAWLEAQDHTRAYAYLRRLMQILLWQRRGERWVLKSPHHMEHLDVVFDVFPEARVVQTHRDPRKTMASFCSMVAHGRGIFSDSVDAHAVARHWVRKVRRLLDLSSEVRDTRDGARFIDVSYDKLTRDPVAEVARIYAFAGIDFTGARRRAVEAARHRSVQHEHGWHRYRLEDFRLSEESIEREFGAYRERFAIPHEF